MFINWKRLLLAVYRLEEGQQEILAKLDRMEKKDYPPVCFADSPPDKAGRDEWMQSGIDNILSYQAGKKKEEE